MTEAILVINAGSSSIKFQLFAVAPDDRLVRRFKGQIEGIGTRPRLVAVTSNREILVDETWPSVDVADLPAALDKVIAFLRPQIGGELPAAVGHRVVHGGPHYASPVAVTSRVLAELEKFVALAPLHQPNNLAPIRAVLQRRPHLLQVACFDTAFHRGHPEVADCYAIPQSLYAEGVRRYGFHGLSYEYIAQRLSAVAPDVASGRIVVAHLGSGASMCAISNGQSVESTMGFTAMDGLPMGTRPGQLDPGVVLYLLNEKGMSAEAIETFLYKDCGLKGLSGISNDVRELLASPDPRAQMALDYFTYRIALFTGMLAAAMGGIDGFVFTAGIGENAPLIREAVIRRLSWLGLDVSTQANKKNAPCISRKGARVPCFVIPTDEEFMIATHTLRVLRERTASALEEKRA
ncbi:acetate/propionate family kinase [Hyphomicrobium sp. LHD-15]|uniref:acetate/propionate family kinase n=1 Tax=Hyphomicrobium sp. LHD-15 TaxID=3072142 RepID=UPI00280C7E23|nr:acetate/propionate family kinase [Hyphomicrobium sp. LHD-15]MDQ8700856.1 acetate/propionate family kinase [Hyphomicrobium sp. LHD-15]